MESVPQHPMNDASMLAFLQHEAEGRPQLVPNPVVEPANNGAGAGAGAGAGGGAAAVVNVPVAGLSDVQLSLFTTIVVYDPNDARFQVYGHCPVCMDDWSTLQPLELSCASPTLFQTPQAATTSSATHAFAVGLSSFRTR